MIVLRRKKGEHCQPKACLAVLLASSRSQAMSRDNKRLLPAIILALVRYVSRCHQAWMATRDPKPDMSQSRRCRRQPAESSRSLFCSPYSSLPPCPTAPKRDFAARGSSVRIGWEKKEFQLVSAEFVFANQNKNMNHFQITISLSYKLLLGSCFISTGWAN